MLAKFSDQARGKIQAVKFPKPAVDSAKATGQRATTLGTDRLRKLSPTRKGRPLDRASLLRPITLARADIESRMHRASISPVLQAEY